MSEIASDQINELATALAKAQGEMKNAEMHKTNPHFKSKFADLAAVREATIPALSANGLALVQFTEVVNAGMILHTRLMHSSGQWIDSSYALAVDLEKPQAVGSALTYAKRYSWTSMCGIASEEDDDGNAAQDQSKSNGSRVAGPVVPHQRHVYTTLAESLKSTKNEADFVEWNRKHGHEIAGLDETYSHMLRQIYREHKTTYPKMSLAEKAIAVDKAVNAPMPDDAIPF